MKVLRRCRCCRLECCATATASPPVASGVESREYAAGGNGDLSWPKAAIAATTWMAEAPILLVPDQNLRFTNPSTFDAFIRSPPISNVVLMPLYVIVTSVSAVP